MDIRSVNRSEVRAGAVLFLDPLSRSIRDRRFQFPIAGEPLLGHFAQSLSETDVRRCCVVAADPTDAEAALTVLRPYGCTVACCPDAIQLATLVDLMSRIDADHIAVLQLEYLLAPYRLLSALLGLHIDAQADITYALDLPERVSPLIFNLAGVQSLLQIYPSYIARDLSTLRTLIPTVNQLKSPSSKRLNIYTPSVRAFYPVPEMTNPRGSARIAFSTPADFAILESTLLNAPPVVSAPFGRLATWRSEAINFRIRERSVFKRSRRPASVDSNRNKKVLYVSNPAAYSGAEESLIQLVSQLSKHEFELHALVSQRGFFCQRLEDAGVTVHCPNRDFAASSIENFIYMNQLYDEIGPTIVHLNSISGIPAAAAAELKNIPLVLHARNAFPEIYLDYVHSADVIIAVSEYIRELLLGLDIPEQKVQLAYDEVDPVYFSKGEISTLEARKRLGLPLNSRIVTCISRFAPNKQHPLLIQAFAQVRETIHDAHLVLKGETFGDVEYRHRVQNLIEQLNLSECTTVVGFLDDIRTLYAASDTLVLCSKNEAFGRCVAEAMAMEVPVVVTRGGGASEIVQDGCSGMVVEHDPRSVAAALVRILTDEGATSSFTKRAREIACDKLDANKSARIIADIYRRLLSTAAAAERQCVASA